MGRSGMVVMGLGVWLKFRGEDVKPAQVTMQAGYLRHLVIVDFESVSSRVRIDKETCGEGSEAFNHPCPGLSHILREIINPLLIIACRYCGTRDSPLYAAEP